MDYDKIWSLFNSETSSKRAMARIVEMSPSGFNSMMESRTMRVDTLELIAKHFKKPLHYFFDDSSNEKKINDPPVVENSKCPLCLEKDKRIRDLEYIVELQKELLSKETDLGNKSKSGLEGRHTGS